MRNLLSVIACLVLVGLANSCDPDVQTTPFEYFESKDSTEDGVSVVYSRDEVDSLKIHLNVFLPPSSQVDLVVMQFGDGGLDSIISSELVEHTYPYARAYYCTVGQYTADGSLYDLDTLGINLSRKLSTGGGLTPGAHVQFNVTSLDSLTAEADITIGPTIEYVVVDFGDSILQKVYSDSRMLHRYDFRSHFVVKAEAVEKGGRYRIVQDTLDFQIAPPSLLQLKRSKSVSAQLHTNIHSPYVSGSRVHLSLWDTGWKNSSYHFYEKRYGSNYVTENGITFKISDNGSYVEKITGADYLYDEPYSMDKIDVALYFLPFWGFDGEAYVYRISGQAARGHGTYLNYKQDYWHFNQVNWDDSFLEVKFFK